VVVHNAVGGAFGSYHEIRAETLAMNFQVNTMALLHLAQRFVTGMAERGAGALIVTGNTSALRGRAKFAGFVPTSAAQRILSGADVDNRFIYVSPKVNVLGH
jgi:short-subunit dehydrogenase